MEATGGPETPQPPPPSPPPPGAQPPATIPQEARDYPAWGEVDVQDRYWRWGPLLKWLLAIPHYFVLTVFGIGAFFVLIYAFFAVLFTGQYPRGAFDFLHGFFRYAWRLTAYLYLLVDPYPPFTLGEEPDYPARMRIEYPDYELERWRPLVNWILAIPYVIIANALHTVGAIFAFIGGFYILFTEELPDWVKDFVPIAMRWQLRGGVFAYWMTNRYPPFVWG